MFRRSSVNLDSMDIAVKSSLIERLKECVKELQLKYTADQWTALKNEEATNNLCWILEAVFIHGLKNTFLKSISVFSSRRENSIPNPSFWDFVMIFSHRDVIEQIRKLNYVNTDIGRGRAWIRITLNEMSLVSYLENMFRNTSYVRSFYKPSAFLRDAEQCDILKNYLVGIVDSCKFDLVVDNSLINQWNSGPLALVGLWVDDNICEGIDVAQNMDSKDMQAIPQLGKSKTPEPDFMQALRRQPLLPEEDAFRIIMASKPSGNNGSGAPSAGSSRRNSDSSQPGTGIATRIPIPSSHLTPSYSLQVSQGQSRSLPKPSPPSQKPTMEKFIVPEVAEKQPTESNPFIEEDQETEELTEPVLENCSNDSDSDAEIDSFNDDTADSVDKNVKAIEEYDEGLSYADLLTTYNRDLKILAPIYPENIGQSVVTTNYGLNETTSSSEPQPSDEILDGFEIVTGFSSKDSCPDMLPKISKYSVKIANEVGLDTQSYACMSCRAQIGIDFVPVRVCYFTGYNFCGICHASDGNVIPARILLNWDFKLYSVCKQAYEFIDEIKDEALFDVNEINPKLYTHSDELEEIQKLRTKLIYISVYIKTCKDPDILEDFKKEVWPRDHLYEKVHLYSISDLLNVPNRNLATTLSKLLKLGKSHITACKVCKAKGFVCEVCRNPEVIFPFNLESIFKCPSCGAVYHKKCMSHAKPCPRCQRWKVSLNDQENCDDEHC